MFKYVVILMITIAFFTSACVTHVHPTHPATTKKVWVPGHYNKHGVWIPGHYRRR